MSWKFCWAALQSLIMWPLWRAAYDTNGAKWLWGLWRLTLFDQQSIWTGLLSNSLEILDLNLHAHSSFIFDRSDRRLGHPVSQDVAIKIHSLMFIFIICRYTWFTKTNGNNSDGRSVSSMVGLKIITVQRNLHFF